jgi:hypothetical protein
MFSSRPPGANAGMPPQGEIQVLPLRGVALAVIQATTEVLPHYLHVLKGDDAHQESGNTENGGNSYNRSSPRSTVAVPNRLPNSTTTGPLTSGRMVYPPRCTPVSRHSWGRFPVVMIASEAPDAWWQLGPPGPVSVVGAGGRHRRPRIVVAPEVAPGVERYRVQLQAYGRAVTEAAGEAVAGLVLLFLNTGGETRVTVEPDPAFGLELH